MPSLVLTVGFSIIEQSLSRNIRYRVNMLVNSFAESPVIPRDFERLQSSVASPLEGSADFVNGFRSLLYDFSMSTSSVDAITRTDLRSLSTRMAGRTHDQYHSQTPRTC